MRFSLLFTLLALIAASHAAPIPYASLVESSAHNHVKSFDHYFSMKRYNMDEVDHLGKTALIHAACNGNVNFVKRLIKEKASIIMTDKTGKTALHHLLICQPKAMEDIFDLILDAKMPLNMSDDEGVTPLILASKYGYTKFVRTMLRNGAMAHLADKKGRTPLMAASAYGHEEIVRLILEKKVEVNLYNEEGKTALFYADQFGHDKIVALLKDAGAKGIAVRRAPEARLLQAAEQGNAAVVKQLLKEGADVNAAYENSGTTALMEAVTKGDAAIVEALLSAGADVNAQDSMGQSALMHAILAHKEKIVELLLAAEADVSLRTAQGKSAKDLAAENYLMPLVPHL